MDQKLLLPGELVKPITSLNGYWVTSFGRVFSNRPRNGKGGLTEEFRLIALNKTSGGRYLHFGADGKKFLVHRVVALAFIGTPPEGTEVSHKDGNSYNNNADNLEYLTHSKNERMKKLHGTSPTGSKNSMAKLSEEDVREIKEILRVNKTRGVLTMLAKQYGVSVATVHNIKKGKVW